MNPAGSHGLSVPPVTRMTGPLLRQVQNCQKRAITYRHVIGLIVYLASGPRIDESLSVVRMPL